MAIKAVNDICGLDGIMLTLLIFRIYLKVIMDLPLFINIFKRADAMYKIIISL